MEPRPGIVPDTNVLVSARLQLQAGNSASPSVMLLHAVADGQIELYTSIPLLFELAATLQKPRLATKYRLSEADAVEFMELVGSMATEIVPIRALDFGVRDPKDSKVVETAYNSRAKFIVARDRDFDDESVRRMLEKRGIRVVDVKTILKEVLSLE